MFLTIEELRRRDIATMPGSHIENCVVDYKKIEIVAVRLSRLSIFRRPLLLPWKALAVSDNDLQIQDAAVLEGKTLEPNRYGELMGKDVFTERRRMLGRVNMYKLETETGQITALWVRTPLVLQSLWKQMLVISRSQIVEITASEVRVDELVVKTAMKPETVAEFAAREAEAF